MKRIKWLLLTLSAALLLLLSACGPEEKEPEPERSPISPPSIQPDSVTGASPAASRDDSISDSLPHGGSSGNSSVIASPFDGGGEAVDSSSGGTAESDSANSSSTAGAGSIELPIISVKDLQP